MCISPPTLPVVVGGWGDNARHSTVNIAQENDGHRTKFLAYLSLSTEFLDPPLMVPSQRDIEVKTDASCLEYNSSVSRIPGDGWIY